MILIRFRKYDQVTPILKDTALASCGTQDWLQGFSPRFVGSARNYLKERLNAPSAPARPTSQNQAGQPGWSNEKPKDFTFSQRLSLNLLLPSWVVLLLMFKCRFLCFSCSTLDFLNVKYSTNKIYYYFFILFHGCVMGIVAFSMNGRLT